MAVSLSKQTAQKIVYAVKDVCGYHINFINTKGIIFASTDTSRIGDYHEVGKQAIDSQTIIEVDSDHDFDGTHKGVNIPFMYNRELIAVIGISGEPKEVRRYAVLAQKITYLILREQEIDFLNYGKRNQLNYMIRVLTGQAEMDHEFLAKYLADYKLSLEMNCCTVVITSNEGGDLSRFSLIETDMYQIVDRIPAALCTFDFPNEYILILPEEQWKRWSGMFHTLARKYKSQIKIGIGSVCCLKKQEESYQAAQVALNSLSGDNIALFDNLDLEILLGCVTENTKNKYLQKILSKLGAEDIELLRVYFSSNLSLKETSEILFLHKNTLQYRLNKIKDLCGYNPRVFRDAVNLYLAAKLHR